MPPHADSPRSQPEPAADVFRVELVPIGHFEEIALVRLELPESSANARASLRRDERGQGAFSIVTLLAGPRAEPLKRRPLAARRSAPVHADVPGSLKEKGGERSRPFDSPGPKRFEGAPEDLLHDILGLDRAAESSGREEEQPLSELLDLQDV